MNKMATRAKIQQPLLRWNIDDYDTWNKNKHFYTNFEHTESKNMENHKMNEKEFKLIYIEINFDFV